ncbi:DMT family transporter [Curtobacterium sp. NPDC089689]|uniref:DMT family transporter n=1 Tax=Curtobacterium sp. NPDC089689 TaxID=3363968 RepID=UPI0037FD4052
MAWVVLFVSAALETVWATALGESHGFTRLGPSLVFAATIAVSLGAFGYVLRHIPISTAYAVWTGTGAALTVLWGMATGAEPVTFLRLLFIAGIVGCVVGLKLVPARPARRRARRDPVAPARDSVGAARDSVSAARDSA